MSGGVLVYHCLSGLTSLHPLQEPFPSSNDPLALVKVLELSTVPTDLPFDPLDIQLGLRSFQLRFGYTSIAQGPFGAEKDLCDLSPITIHHVGLVELDLEEEGGPRFVQRQRNRAPSVGRGFGDLSADDKPLECFTLPFSGLADLRSEIPNLLDGVEYGGSGFNETPLVCELVDNVGQLCAEVFRVLVDTVKMES